MSTFGRKIYHNFTDYAPKDLETIIVVKNVIKKIKEEFDELTEQFEQKHAETFDYENIGLFPRIWTDILRFGIANHIINTNPKGKHLIIKTNKYMQPLVKDLFDFQLEMYTHKRVKPLSIEFQTLWNKHGSLWTQEQYSDALKVSQPTISRLKYKLGIHELIEKEEII